MAGNIKGGEKLTLFLNNLEESAPSTTIRVGFLDDRLYPDSTQTIADVAATLEYGGNFLKGKFKKASKKAQRDAVDRETLAMPLSNSKEWEAAHHRQVLAPYYRQRKKDLEKYGWDSNRADNVPQKSPDMGVMIPPTHFMRTLSEQKRALWDEEIARRMKVEKYDVKQIANEMGEMIMGQFQEAINDIGKTSHVTSLVDIEVLVGAVTYNVE